MTSNKVVRSILIYGKAVGGREIIRGLEKRFAGLGGGFLGPESCI